jgi:hypothetical protein
MQALTLYCVPGHREQSKTTILRTAENNIIFKTLHTHLFLILSKEKMAEVFLASPSLSGCEADVFPFLTTLHTQKNRPMSKSYHSIVF